MNAPALVRAARAVLDADSSIDLSIALVQLGASVALCDLAGESGDACPSCGGELAFDNHEMLGDGNVTQESWCGACGRAWLDVYVHLMRVRQEQPAEPENPHPEEECHASTR